jgi:hypothetical protein
MKYMRLENGVVLGKQIPETPGNPMDIFRLFW